ncbi:hypothetical protein [Leifsonia sp. TF02-11]|uniref:hypothetical protein n=1 Tax=Leifsonia sp. TF02-11 TaxID=2815212 RepID=UPI001AA0C58A|nr:hypothetical protein [Leifsonia sp. TF02-11]MBO1737104.1 hypothetical protein [Leifsonia sp. TF02-11]
MLIVLAVILALEALLVTGLALWLLYDLLTLTPQSYTTAIAITLLVAIGAAWVIVTFVGILRLHAWARASTVTIQILMVAVAVGSFQGLVARPDVGWALLIPAVVAFVLALAPSVVRATAREVAPDDVDDHGRNTTTHE